MGHATVAVNEDDQRKLERDRDRWREIAIEAVAELVGRHQDLRPLLERLLRRPV